MVQLSPVGLKRRSASLFTCITQIPPSKNTLSYRPSAKCDSHVQIPTSRNVKINHFQATNSLQIGSSLYSLFYSKWTYKNAKISSLKQFGDGNMEIFCFDIWRHWFLNMADFFHYSKVFSQIDKD